MSCAAAQATLQVIEEERLIDNAGAVGDYLAEGLRKLAQRYAVIGDIRGAGLFIGVELVVDRDTQEPNSFAATHLVNALRSRRILISATGPHANVLKIRPPLVFGREHADLLLEAIDEILGEYHRNRSIACALKE